MIQLHYEYRHYFAKRAECDMTIGEQLHLLIWFCPPNCICGVVLKSDTKGEKISGRSRQLDLMPAGERLAIKKKDNTETRWRFTK